MKITLCDKDLIGDIKSYEFEKESNYLDFFYDWIKKKNFNESVFVCFPSWQNVEYRDIHNSILVSANWDDITAFTEDYIFSNYSVDSYSIFEFSSYEEAFKYCIDLKEGV